MRNIKQISLKVMLFFNIKAFCNNQMILKRDCSENFSLIQCTDNNIHHQISYYK